MESSALSEEKKYSVQEIQQDPLKFIEKLIRESPDEIISYWVNNEKVILVNNPIYIKQVLQTEEAFFVKDGTPEMMMLHPILGNGLLTSLGEAWKIQRNIARQGFTTEKIAKFSEMMVDETLDLMHDWKVGDEKDLESELSQLTLRIVSKALFGDSLNAVAAEFGQAVQTINLYMGHFDPSDHAGRMQFIYSLNWLKNVVRQMIQQRLKESQKYDDFLATLLEHHQEGTFSEDNLIDQVFTFLMAGHETTAKTLTWTLYELHKNPIIFERLIQEISTVIKQDKVTLNDAASLRYTWKVLQESMRLNPPIWVISRKSIRDSMVGNILIPKNTLVILSPYMIHRHPSFWENPNEFNPERFNNIESDKRPVYAYLPFSGGPRHCVGKNFASLEVILVLATLLKNFKFELKEGFVVEPEALVTLRPKNGMKMILKQRL